MRVAGLSLVTIVLVLKLVLMTRVCSRLVCRCVVRLVSCRPLRALCSLVSRRLTWRCVILILCTLLLRVLSVPCVLISLWLISRCRLRQAWCLVLSDLRGRALVVSRLLRLWVWVLSARRRVSTCVSVRLSEFSVVCPSLDRSVKWRVLLRVLCVLTCVLLWRLRRAWWLLLSA